jgi:hypothetical protein
MKPIGFRRITRYPAGRIKLDGGPILVFPLEAKIHRANTEQVACAECMGYPHGPSEGRALILSETSLLVQSRRISVRLLGLDEKLVILRAKQLIAVAR